MMVSCFWLNTKRKTNQSGFSLIEVSIALIVIGLLIVPLIVVYNQYIMARQVTMTKSAVSIVNSALVKYVAKYGHYPFPSDPGVAEGTPGFGLPVADVGITVAWPACTATATTVCQTNINAYNPILTNPACPNLAVDRGVLIGAVPFAALGIPYRATLDGYGGRLTYAVTRTLAYQSQYNEVCGALEVLNSAGISIYAVPATTQRSHFIVVSHGQDRAGAFGLGGIKGTACNTNINSTDFENCNNDARFRNNLNAASGRNDLFYAAGVTHFDDLTATNNTSSSGIWTNIPNSPSMRSGNAGNVYVGNCTAIPCIPKVKMDVKGSVRADSVRTKRFCYRDPAFCTEPEATGVNYVAGLSPPGYYGPDFLVGAPATGILPDSTNFNALYTWNATNRSHNGAGIRCSGYRGVMGTNNFSEICSGEGANSAYFKPSVVATVGACATGEYPRGVTATGQLICQLP
jgi:prepilin-type N-terminal cleavage/methylation domain-containing protein